jgi:hypothetical protein
MSCAEVGLHFVSSKFVGLAIIRKPLPYGLINLVRKYGHDAEGIQDSNEAG